MIEHAFFNKNNNPRSTIKPSNNIFWLVLGVLGLGSMLFMYWLTPHGPSLSPDSMSYLVGARNILLGKGYTVTGRPETHFPPFYSFTLALVLFFVKDILQAARILDSVIFGLNIMSSVGLIYWTTRRNSIAAGLAGVSLLVSVPFVIRHTYALTEGLFIFFSLACIFFLSLFISKQSKTYLIFSAVSLSLCILTRYIGASYIPVAMGVVFLMTSKRTRQQGWGNMLIYLLGSGFLPGLFFVQNWLTAAEVTDRSLVFHPINPLNYIKMIYLETCKFFMPFPVFQIGLSAVISILLLLLILLALWKIRPTFCEIDWNENANLVPLLAILFSAAYIAFLFISITFFDAATPVNERILLPVFIFFLIGIFPTVLKATRVLNKPMLGNAFLLFVMLMAIIKSPIFYTNARSLRSKNMGYQIHDFDHSEIVAIANNTSRVVKIYSNSTDLLRFLTVREIEPLPYIDFPTTSIHNANYKQELDSMCQEVARKEAILIFLKAGSFRKYFPSSNDLQLACSLSKLTSYPEGIIIGSFEK